MPKFQNGMVPWNKGNSEKCYIEGCDKRQTARGLCQKHYDFERRGKFVDHTLKICIISRCTNKYYAKGLCEIHYNNKYLKEWTTNNLKNWEIVIPEETTCEICSDPIFFKSEDLGNSIRFDHRHEGKETIKGSPTSWLCGHKFSEEYRKIWDSCDFGMLCDMCNSFLPTLGRKQFILNAIKYVFGVQVTEEDLMHFKTIGALCIG